MKPTVLGITSDAGLVVAHPRPVTIRVLEAVESGHKQLSDIASAAHLAPGAAACLLDSLLGCGLIVRERERGRDVYLP